MSDKELINEATGVYVGTLQEDMIETVVKTGRLCCDVWIPSIFDSSKHPLTHVPLWCMTLPLMKGDKVLVKFNQDNFSYPVLYKAENDNPVKGISKEISTPDGDQKVICAHKLGEDSFIIKTEKDTVLKQNSTVIVLKSDGKIYLNGNKNNLVTYDALEKVLNSMVSTFNTHTHEGLCTNSAGEGTISATPTTNQMNISTDLPNAKTNNIFTD